MLVLQSHPAAKQILKIWFLYCRQEINYYSFVTWASKRSICKVKFSISTAVYLWHMLLVLLNQFGNLQFRRPLQPCKSRTIYCNAKNSPTNVHTSSFTICMIWNSQSLEDFELMITVFDLQKIIMACVKMRFIRILLKGKLI